VKYNGSLLLKFHYLSSKFITDTNFLRLIMYNRGIGMYPEMYNCRGRDNSAA
jgi:hypothetical protein